MDTFVHARPQSEQMAHARTVLAALSDRPGSAGLAAIEAFCVLDDVGPPYPPVVELPPGSAVTDQDAIDALVAAVDECDDSLELARLVEAAYVLRDAPRW